jgi:peroxiredoxin
VQSVKDQFEKYGVAIVAISFAEPERLVRYQQHHQWPFLLLADPDRAAYRYFNLKCLPWYRIFSPSALKMYFHLLRKGRKIEDYGKDDYYQAGGDFLVDREGNVLFAYRSHNPSDRPSVDQLLEEVRKLKEKH